MSSFVSSRRSLVAPFAIGLALCLVTCSAFAEKTKPKAKSDADESSKPWLNAKGLCVFQFGANGLPQTADGFALALDEGCRKGIELPDDAQVVEIDGGETYPALRVLRVNLSDAKIDFDPKRKTSKPPENYVPRGMLQATSFQLFGHRLAFEDARLSVGVSASDVRFDFTRDRKGRPFLMLADAKDGELLFEMTHADLESLIYAAFRKGAVKYGVAVNSTRLKLRSEDGGHSLIAELKVNTTFAGIPAGLKFRARFDVDDHLNGKISGLTCTGDQVLGPLISGVIQPALKQYDGKERPLVAFPKGRVQLHDISINTDERVRVSAKFGS